MLHRHGPSSRLSVDKPRAIHTTCGGSPPALTWPNTILSTINSPYHYYYRCYLK